MDRLSVIGLGKLGACSAACFASKGFDVVGVDINKAFVEAINAGKAPVYEPRLQELMDKAGGKLRATCDYGEAIAGSDITFLIVPTPSREDGTFSDKYLKDALKHLALELRKAGKKNHLFVITSTVSPGTIEESLIPLLESESGKKLNKEFEICYNPEFIALGSVINDFLNPDMVLIGESDKAAGERLSAVYKKVCENSPCIARMSVISAEITKISLNSYVTMKISYANTLANICGSVPGADIDDITKALGADKRIASYYLKGGLSFGGPCFPRDNRAFASFARKYGVDAKLARATDEVNEMQIKSLVSKVFSSMPEGRSNKIAVLGMSYKPKTPVMEESASVKLVDEILKKDLQVMIYDPLAMDNARAYFGDRVLYASSVRDCFTNSNTCVITTQDDEFRAIDGGYIRNTPTTIIDCWRILSPQKLGKGVKYIPFGKLS